MYVTEARAKKIPVETITIPMHDVDRAIADGEEEGFVKIHVRSGTDCILGATVVARHAGEMISDLSLAMSAGIGMRTLAHVSHPYPTQASAIKMAATVYCRSHRPEIEKWLASLLGCAGVPNDYGKAAFRRLDRLESRSAGRIAAPPWNRTVWQWNCLIQSAREVR